MKNTNRLYKLPIRSIVPNALTILSLSAGLAGLKYGFLGMWEASVIAILIAGVLDGLDGRVARMLKGATNFGAELDSLVDFVNFGVVPAMVMYMWVLQEVKGVGWFFALLFAVCMVLRLARFNTMSKDELLSDKELSKEFFTGVPAPAAAALALWPMILHFETGFDLFKNPWVCIIYMGFMAFLTVSTLPTFSFKTVKVKKEHVLFYLIGVAAVAAMLLNFAWITLSVIGSLYLGLMPVAYFSMKKKLKAQAEAKKPQVKMKELTGTVANEAEVSSKRETASGITKTKPKAASVKKTLVKKKPSSKSAPTKRAPKKAAVKKATPAKATAKKTPVKKPAVKKTTPKKPAEKN